MLYPLPREYCQLYTHYRSTTVNFNPIPAVIPQILLPCHSLACGRLLLSDYHRHVKTLCSKMTLSELAGYCTTEVAAVWHSAMLLMLLLIMYVG